MRHCLQPDRPVCILQANKAKNESGNFRSHRHRLERHPAPDHYMEQYDDGRTEYKKAAFRAGSDPPGATTSFLRGHIGNDRAEALCDAMRRALRRCGVFPTARDYRACATSGDARLANGRDIRRTRAAVKRHHGRNDQRHGGGRHMIFLQRAA